MDGLLDSLRVKMAEQISARFESEYSHTGRALDVAQQIGAGFESDNSHGRAF